EDEWVDTWNDGVTSFNNAGNNIDSLTKTASLFQAAYRLDNSDPEPMRLLGATYLALADTNKALQAYMNYISAVDANVNKGINLGINVGEPESQIVTDLGKPDMVKSIPTADSVKMYDYHGKNMRLFIAADPQVKGTMKLVGWQYYTGSSQADIDRVERISIEPYRMVGNIFYQRGSALMLASSLQGGKTTDSTLYKQGVDVMDTALTYFTTAQRLNPADEFSSTMLSEIYLRTNQIDKASASYEDLIKKFPTNKFTRVNFGILLLKQNKYEDAIKQFDEALNIDPNYNLALYYIAISYKNWGADIQSAVRTSGVKETDADREKYLSKLRKSAEYFEKLHALTPNDYAPLGQLAEIYSILQENAKVKTTLTSLEAMESSQSDNPEYWNTLGKLYTVLNDVTKAKDAFDKVEALQKK
ncbi:MAG TPA: tetratricopeptide repeat protein, partial [Candidatus Kapabacteria bacterium]|nr:tetratricopeptide repeat protein [Candidatus Kapabacteria bacterium]